MDTREKLIDATMRLIEEKGDQIEDITVREICQKAGVGLGLVNYHFGSKERLIEACAKKIINGIIEQFEQYQDDSGDTDPPSLLLRSGELTLDYLFSHESLSRISIQSDSRAPRADDNTQRTIQAYLPLVASCHPDWDEKTVRRKAFTLVMTMQQLFNRYPVILEEAGLDLRDPAIRNDLHEEIVRDVMEMPL